MGRSYAGMLSGTKTQRALGKLAESGMYLFHGSPVHVATLEPRQPLTATKAGPVPDGGLAVCASNDPRYALLMAICSGRVRCSSGWYESDEATWGLVQAVDHEQLRQQGELEGYVYVCRRSAFHPWGGVEWRSNQAVRPERVIHVTQRDLPEPLLEVSGDGRPFTPSELEQALGDPHRYGLRPPGPGSAPTVSLKPLPAARPRRGLVEGDQA